jgi:hypothetical protein
MTECRGKVEERMSLAAKGTLGDHPRKSKHQCTNTSNGITTPRAGGRPLGAVLSTAGLDEVRWLGSAQSNEL